ncbi:hypothetical protein F9K33_00115 [bacterium]|nr:MAG: hypothetical protein F9K33_00115 [bacterium]
MLYPWYETVDSSNVIFQGDLIPECPIVKPPDNLELDTMPEVEIQRFNSIVVSQSCDLENDKIEIVLVCPYLTLSEYLSQLPENYQNADGRKNVKKALKQGHYPSNHLLNKDEQSGLSDFIVVDFRNVYGVSFDYLKKYVYKIPKRIRLLPPYREHLSQAFARFFMRVGLPSNIDI